ncbi:hypothetical protein CTEN210_00787 [Chaetoceros tenuissimus]|uniref:Uncharacterized protein n=1 Tax=Chaetoceros tenuissimus TaxID=426638 RepID=A0AAD3GZA1_9STRA|nr:hypothetical protein CTEN210_00787 [Chaetoceros tenuissimus]
MASFRTANISTSSSSFSNGPKEFEFVYEDTLPMIPSTLKERKRIFKELEVAFKSQVTTDELGHDKRAKKIHMNKPIPTVYNQHYSKSTKIKKQTRIGTDIYNVSTTSDNGIHEAPFRSLKVEARGITYRQMSAIMANVKRRCEKEGWTREVVDSETNRPSGTYIRLTPDIVNMHDIERYVIGPYTQATGRSLVESLPSTAGTQPPRFFVVHTWNEKYENAMACIKTMIHDFSSNKSTIDDERGGGMTIDTPIWIDAFALGPCQSNDETRKSSIVTAMETTNLRSVVLLDRFGDIFSNIECLKQIEMSLCLSRSRRLSIDMDYGESRKGKSLAVYTSVKHSYEHPKYGKLSRKAIGLCQGRATIDANYTFHASIREHSFPTDRLKTMKGLKIDDFSDVKDFFDSLSPIEVSIPEEIDVYTCHECSIISEISIE